VALRLWRIVKQKHAATAFDGEGARRFAGRWNKRGTTIVYLSETLSLAALETFVHLSSEDSRFEFVAIEVEVPDDVAVDQLDPADLPPNWRAEPPLAETKAMGTAWVASGTAALLRVPSVIVPIEANYLLNPAHPDFARLRIGPPRPFGFDERMWK
jgi:RES domain-containing protein